MTRPGRRDGQMGLGNGGDGRNVPTSAGKIVRSAQDGLCLKSYPEQMIRVTPMLPNKAEVDGDLDHW